LVALLQQLGEITGILDAVVQRRAVDIVVNGDDQQVGIALRSPGGIRLRPTVQPFG